MSDTTVMEAFQSMKLLEDAETFKPVSKDDMSDLSYFLDNDENVDEVSIIDTDAKDEDDLQDSYEGKVIIQCPVCKSLVYKEEGEIVADEDEDDDKKLVNVSEECPYCHTQSGFVIVGKVVPFEEDEIEVKEKDNEEKDTEDKRVSGNDSDDEDTDEKDEGFLGIIDPRPSVKIANTIHDTVKAFRDGESYKRFPTRNVTERMNRRERVNESIARRRRSKKLSEGLHKNWRGCKNIDWFDSNAYADPDILWNGYTFNYWDIENALWENFLEETGYTDNMSGDPQVEAEFDKYCQNNAYAYLDDVVSGGYFDNGSKSWHDDYNKHITENLRKRNTPTARRTTTSRVTPRTTSRNLHENARVARRNPIDRDAFRRTPTRPLAESRMNRNLPKRVSRNSLFESDYVDYKRRYDAKDVAKFNRMSQKLRKDPTELGRVLEKYAPEIWTPIREPERFKGAEDVINFWKRIFEKEGVSDTNGMNKLFRNISAKRDIQSMCDAIFNFWMGATGNATIKLRTEALENGAEIKNRGEIRKRVAQRKALDRKRKNTKDFTNKDALKINKDGEVEEGLIGDIVNGAKETGQKILGNLVNPLGSMTEGVQSVNVETDSETITVKNKVSESEEMIQPISEEEVDTILAPEADENQEVANNEEVATENEEEATPVDEVDVDVDDFDDNAFERKTESYLRKVYENVNGFKVTSHKIRGNKVFVEGLISFASGNSHKTKFVFESKAKIAPNKYLLEGMNMNIAKNNKAFQITTSLNGKKLVTESLNYNYVTKDNGKIKRVSNLNK